MTSNKGQRLVIFMAVFALTTLVILYSSTSGNSSVHYSSRDITKLSLPLISRVSNLKKWGMENGYHSVSANKSLNLHCQTCALVSSSSHLLNSSLGPEIDGSECIIRMNDAPTTGFQKDVGNRTTVRVVAHSSIYRVLNRPQEFLNKSPDATLIFWGPPNKMMKEKKGTIYRIIQRVSQAFPNLTALIVSPAKMHHFDELFHRETGRDRQKSHSWLSTGWFTMVIAVEICDKIMVYGMVPPSYCSQKPRPKKMPYHYYEPKGPDECTTYIQNEKGRRGNHHRFITEKYVFARWAKLYNITFFQPHW
ncbi:alpha-N-acetylgalactosaminide alpha-2,6-sialyltransferase 6 [Protopterus annectens]|uniref:alpha-N-acetylgalactosaminide alpha-2,6-sialyltransferase 6 n=1 Tax=Protopterus annectens TaxID=7888 RepID=UPI001CFA379D|nr:alpha-N-acetylgalactosaminide alpha-2,6-sialyltransferase 6 [Protopterus annectens]XP_043921250.1 alpha-N-acetylgalactosaminide alpha-2,6-sialyltransferase 6 [Protopterus annectens]